MAQTKHHEARGFSWGMEPGDQLPIDLTTVADDVDVHRPSRIGNLVDDSIVTLPDTIEAGATKFF